MINVLDYLNPSLENDPDKTAFADEETQYSFKELDRRLKGTGTALLKRGLKRRSVLVFMEKSVKEIAAFFGVIAAGCYYVPVDPEMPLSRIQRIVDNCKPGICIADSTTFSLAEELDIEGGTALYDEISAEETDEEALNRVRKEAIDTDPIYIVFTSGSTGIPKGVAACHRSVIDYIEQLSEVLQVSSETVFGNQAPLYFDACLKELYPTLKYGATTYLIPKKLFSLPAKLVAYLNDHKINTICWVASALTIVSSLKTFRKIKPEFLKTVAFGSEVFPVKQYNSWKEACPGARFINLYGPTEATGMSCYHVLDRDYEETEAIPVGKPFKNTRLLLIKEDGTEAGKGEEGEIVLSGTCVTLGYYNDPDRTYKSFVQNPLQNAYPEKVYRTGDLGYLNEDGDLVFISRRDNQIKHMGHRIELGEIEAAASQTEGAGLNGCIYDEDRGKIILYYTGDIRETDLIGELKALLPRFMVPNQVYHLEEMMFTANGKIDRNALKKLYERNKG